VVYISANVDAPNEDVSATVDFQQPITIATTDIQGRTW
jgi:hypothetical protein